MIASLMCPIYCYVRQRSAPNSLSSRSLDHDVVWACLDEVNTAVIERQTSPVNSVSWKSRMAFYFRIKTIKF